MSDVNRQLPWLCPSTVLGDSGSWVTFDTMAAVLWFLQATWKRLALVKSTWWRLHSNHHERHEQVSQHLCSVAPCQLTVLLDSAPPCLWLVCTLQSLCFRSSVMLHVTTVLVSGGTAIPDAGFSFEGTLATFHDTERQDFPATAPAVCAPSPCSNQSSNLLTGKRV
jgi:hypothetical protein